MALLFTVAVKGDARKRTGKEVWAEACVTCHGTDGRGMSQARVGLEIPLPDFTDCRFTVREPNTDWMAVVHDGGPARGFSVTMPAFGEALSLQEIEDVANYMRGFCRDRAWPRGELNLPRPLMTEKAFPEDEAVIETTINAESPSALTERFVYEKRFGARNMVEAKVPFQFAGRAAGGWAGAVGDMSLGYKRVLAHSIRTGSIFSLSGEAVLPTGDTARGFGKGVTVFETFASFGQILPKDGFIQAQTGFEFPTHTDDAARAMFWRTAVGKTFTQHAPFGRAWSPMVEFVADREFEDGARVNWDVAPQLHFTISARQHIMANFGVKIPANNTAGRPVQIMFHLLWDWFDGGLRQGW